MDVRRLVNLTPHDWTISYPGGTTRLPASGQLARIDEHQQGAGILHFDQTPLPFRTVELGEVTGIPDPEEGTLYLVSRLVALAAHRRGDLVCPGPAIRDEHGRTIAADGLTFIHKPGVVGGLDDD